MIFLSPISGVFLIRLRPLYPDRWKIGQQDCFNYKMGLDRKKSRGITVTAIRSEQKGPYCPFLKLDIRGKYAGEIQTES